MNNNDFLDWLRGIFFVMVIVFLTVGIIWGVTNLGSRNREKNCAKLGEQIGYNTKVFSGYCRIEVRPNLWISEYDIAKFLSLIDCEKE